MCDTSHRKWSEPCFVHLNGVWISYANSFVTLQILMYLNKCNIQITKLLRNICIYAHFARNRVLNCLQYSCFCFMHHDYFHTFKSHTTVGSDFLILRGNMMDLPRCVGWWHIPLTFLSIPYNFKSTAYKISGTKNTHIFTEKDKLELYIIII